MNVSKIELGQGNRKALERRHNSPYVQSFRSFTR